MAEHDSPMKIRCLLETLVQTQIILTDSLPPPQSRKPNTFYFRRNTPIIARVKSLVRHYLRTYHSHRNQLVSNETIEKEELNIMRILYGEDYGTGEEVARVIEVKYQPQEPTLFEEHVLANVTVGAT